MVLKIAHFRSVFYVLAKNVIFNRFYSFFMCVCCVEATGTFFTLISLYIIALCTYSDGSSRNYFFFLLFLSHTYNHTASYCLYTQQHQCGSAKEKKNKIVNGKNFSFTDTCFFHFYSISGFSEFFFQHNNARTLTNGFHIHSCYWLI